MSTEIHAMPEVMSVVLNCRRAQLRHGETPEIITLISWELWTRLMIEAEAMGGISKAPYGHNEICGSEVRIIHKPGEWAVSLPARMLK